MKTHLLFLILVTGMSVMTLNPVKAQASKPSDPPCWRWEQMKPADLKQALETVPVAYFVISPLEWHGDAMTFGTDPTIGTTIAEKAWKQTGGVIIPTIYLGSETEYKDWTSTGLTSFWGMEWATKEHNPGSLYVSNRVIQLVVEDMMAAVEREGFKACVIVSGHGATEYVRILKAIEDQYKNKPMKVFYAGLADLKRPDGIDFPGSGGHADYAEASNLGAVDSTLVDKSLFGKNERDRKVGILSENVNRIDYDKGMANINFRANRVAVTVNNFLDSLKQRESVKQ